MNVRTTKEVFLGTKLVHQEVVTPSPFPRAITHGLRGQQVISNTVIYAHFWWSRHGTVKHPLSVSKYFPSSFKHKLSVTAHNLSQIANSKYIICISIQIEYSTCRKNRFLRLQKLTIRVVERLTQVYIIWSVPYLKIVQTRATGNLFRRKITTLCNHELRILATVP